METQLEWVLQIIMRFAIILTPDIEWATQNHNKTFAHLTTEKIFLNFPLILFKIR